MTPRPKILVIESNPAHELLTLKAIASSGISFDVQVARNGIEASSLLFNQSSPSPSLVLMELNLPFLSGCEVLCQIRRNADTRRIPVIIFTESNLNSDIESCLDLHANSYVVKDKDPERYETRLKLLLYYWIAVNEDFKSQTIAPNVIVKLRNSA